MNDQDRFDRILALQEEAAAIDREHHGQLSQMSQSKRKLREKCLADAAKQVEARVREKMELETKAAKAAEFYRKYGFMPAS
jgi:hypothetical protein